MKIAILTSGILPIPAVQGGAVENLIDFYLEYNNKYHLHQITVYSVNHPKLIHIKGIDTEVNHYHHIDTISLMAKIKKRIFLLTQGKHCHYHYTIEYFFNEALKQIRNNHYDIIIVENRPGYAFKLKERTSSVLVLHQGNDFLNKETCQHKKLYDAYSCIINNSLYITNRVKTINPSDSKCKTVLNGIDTKLFFQASVVPRSAMGLSKKDFVIVYSGRLIEEKGILPLIQAIKQLNCIQNLKFLIIGASNYGKDKHPSTFIEQLIKEAEQIKDKVIFTGFIDYQEIPSYLKTADIAIVPSMWDEPFGLTVVEAMAAGLPLITTRSGGIPEICEGVAIIVERDNIVENLINAIKELYQNPERREQMKRASLERALSFDKELFAQNFFNALPQV